MPQLLSEDVLAGTFHFRFPDGNFTAGARVTSRQGKPIREWVHWPDQKMRLRFYGGSALGNDSTAQWKQALGFLFNQDCPNHSVDSLGVLNPGVEFTCHGRDSIFQASKVFWRPKEVLVLNCESLESLKAAQETCENTQWNLDSGSVSTLNGFSEFSAALWNTQGLIALEGSRTTQAEADFKKAFILDSSRGDYLANVALMSQFRNQSAQGVSLILNRPKLLENFSEPRGILGALYENMGDYEKARQWALKALEKDPGNREWLINLSDALWGLGERVQSKNVLLRRHAEDPDFRLSVYLAGTFLGLEEFSEAYDALIEAHRHDSPTPKSAEYVLRALVGMKRFEDALIFSGDQGDQFPFTAMGYLLKAVSEFNLKLYREANITVKAALELDPGLRDAATLQAQLTSVIGGRSQQVLKQVVNPLKTQLILSSPSKLVRDSLKRELLTAKNLKLVDAHVAFQWVKGGHWKKTKHLLYLIPSQKKLYRFSEIAFEFNPIYTRFFVNKLVVYDSTLKAKTNLQKSDCYVTGNHGATEHPEILLVHIPIPSQGNTARLVEIQVSEESQTALPQFPFLDQSFQGPYSVVRTRFDILNPPSNLSLSTFGPVRVDSLPGKISFALEESLPPREGSFSAGRLATGAGFTAAPLATWFDVAKAYLTTLAEAGIEPSNPPLPIRERAFEILGPHSFEDPLKQIFRFVRDSIRYSNFEFGLHAQIPDSTLKVLRDGYTDCKGHALLLTQLLQARGVPAQLALINLDYAGDAAQPNINQFNHMVVYIKKWSEKGPWFLDPTDKYTAFRQVPLNFEGHNALVLDPLNPRLETVPALDTAFEHQALVRHHLTLEPDGSAQGEDSLMLTGKAASAFRELVATWDSPTKMQNLLAWMAKGYVNFSERSFEVKGVSDPDANLIMVLRFRTRFPDLVSQKQFAYQPKLELGLLAFPGSRNRQSSFSFSHRIQVESRWIYEIGGGLVFKAQPLERDLEEQYLQWKLSILQPKPAEIRIRQLWTIDPFLAEPEEYARLQAAWNPILERSGLLLRVDSP